ncbi:MAG: hypothetical protein U9Q82_09785, partial [Chloroflexota bacterium]|nr:hypothetical protein [Chloroflexota bacterium]
MRKRTSTIILIVVLFMVIAWLTACTQTMETNVPSTEETKPTIDISNFETPEKSNASVDIAKTVVTKTVDIEAQGRQLPTET